MFSSFLLNALRQPLYQAAIFFLIAMIFVPFQYGRTANAVWNAAGVLYIGFILLNAFYQYSAENTWTYFFISLAASLLYLLAAGLIMPYLINLLNIGGSGESATVFLFIMYHPVILLIVILVKWVVKQFV